MQLRIKQGATLQLTLSFTDASGAPLDLGAATLAAKLRTATGLVVEQLNITATDVPGHAIILSNNTGTYPVGILRCDIAVSGSGITTISETLMLYVEASLQ
jgi:hypothetical protein